MNKPKANLYMLIKIEIDKDIKDTTEFKKEFCKKNDCLWIDSYYNDSETKLPISADYGEYWIEGDYSEECNGKYMMITIYITIIKENK